MTLPRATILRLVPRISVAALILAPFINAWWSPPLVVIVGVCVLRWWAQRIDPRAHGLAGFIIAVFLAHVIFSTVLFVISYQQLPILRDLQLGGGFWAFTPDSDGYHLRALRLLSVLADGTSLPALRPTVVYEVFVAALYSYFGRLPLTPIIVNCWFVSATGLLSYRLARRLGADVNGALAAAVIVTCWPSGFMWSSQLLRDSAALFLMFAALEGAVAVFEVRARLSGRTVLSIVLLIAATVAVTSVRAYIGWLLVGASLAVLLSRMVRFTRPDAGTATAALVFATVLSATVATTGEWLWAGMGANIDAAIALSPGVSESEPAPPRAQSSAQSGAQSSEGTDVSRSPVRFFPRLLEQKRRELLRGSNSPVGADADLSTWSGLLAYAPRGIAAALFAPMPWDWRYGGSTGVFKLLASVESVIMIALFPALVVGGVRTVRRRRSNGVFVLSYCLAALCLLGLLIPNLGGLVRLRTLALLPLLVLAAAEGGLSPYATPLRFAGRAASKLRARLSHDGSPASLGSS